MSVTNSFDIEDTADSSVKKCSICNHQCSCVFYGFCKSCEKTWLYVSSVISKKYNFKSPQLLSVKTSIICKKLISYKNKLKIKNERNSEKQ